MALRQKKADRKKPKAKTPQPEAEQPVQAKAPEPTTLADALKRVRKRANAGDVRAREVLKKFLDAHPEIWSEIGNLARHAELTLIEAVSRGEWFASEAIQREAARMRRVLAGSSPTPLETMAVERVVLTWLQLQHVEARFVQAQTDLDWARYWLKRQEQADRLYRSAVKSLATVRELLPKIEAGQPESHPISSPTNVTDAVLGEKIGVATAGANRIAGLVAPFGRDGDDPAHVSMEGERRLNGHRHRLEELLAAHEG